VFLDVICHGVPLGPQESSGIYNQEKIELGWALVMGMCCFVAVSIQNFSYLGEFFIDSRQSPVSSVRASRGPDTPFPQPVASLAYVTYARSYSSDLTWAVSSPPGPPGSLYFLCLVLHLFVTDSENGAVSH